MCEPISIAVGGIALSAAASYTAQQSASKNAKNQANANNAANIANVGAEYANQEDTARWQDDNWQQDIDFATQTLPYQGKEFAKQMDYVASAGRAVMKNEDAALAQVGLKSVQQNIAATLQEANTNASAAAARASAQVAADGRGVSGNTVNSIIDDVSRQQGQTISVMEMNRSAINQQARLDLEATKAAGDTQLGQIQASVKTYSPSTPIRLPTPVGTITAPQLASAPESSGLAQSLAIGAAGVSGG